MIARSLLELALLGAILAVFAKVTKDSLVLWLTMLSFGLRAAVGIALFLASLAHFALARSLQVPGGFWSFAPDAVVYHHDALLAAGALLGNSPTTSVEYPFSWLIGATYLLFGAVPPAALILNAALAAACVPLAYLTARWSFLPQGASVVVSALIAFWPSSFAWSSQLLKDPLQWLAIFALTAAAAYLLRPSSQADKGLRPRVGLAGVTALLAAALTAWLRAGYESPGWIIAVVVGVGMDLLMLLARHARTRSTKDPNGARSLRLRVVSAIVLVTAVVAGSYPGIRTIQGNVRVATAPLLTTACPTFEPLIDARRRYVASGGGSQIDPTAPASTCADVLVDIPRAFVSVLLAPTPPDWLRAGTSTGGLAQLAGLDAMLLWLLVPGVLVGLVDAFRRAAGVTPVLAIYVLVLSCVLGFVVTNFGTLFRLRLQVILPAAVLAVGGWQLLVQWMARRIPAARGSSPPLAQRLQR